MVALLDVNVLVALFDGSHVHHEAAHQWFATQREAGWATCPLTENGFLRVVTSGSYPGRGTALPDTLDRLATFRASGHHEFWSDSVSLTRPGAIDPTQVAGARQLSDVYLLLLATDRGGALATFDRRIPLAAVPGAGPENLTLVGGPLEKGPA